MANIDIFNDVKDAFGKYIVAPIAQFGLGGFVFDIEGETSINLQADITDHFTEGNFSVQDHIALKPKRVRLNTYVGELVCYGNSTDNTALQKVARKLTTINSYLPQLTAGASQLKSLLDDGQKDITFASVTSTALNIYGMVKNIAPPLPKQQQAYQYFKALYEQKILVSLQTPFEFCSSMAIESITATQDEETQHISNFTITLKEVRTVSTLILSLSAALDARAAQQAAPELNKGITQGSDAPITAVTGAFQ